MSNLPCEILQIVFECIQDMLPTSRAQKQLALFLRVSKDWCSACLPVLYLSIDLLDYIPIWRSHNAAILLSQTLAFHNPSLGTLVTRFIAPDLTANVVALQLLRSMPRLLYLNVSVSFLYNLGLEEFQGKAFPQLEHVKYRGLSLQENEMDRNKKINLSERWEGYAGLVDLRHFRGSKVKRLELVQTGSSRDEEDVLDGVDLEFLRMHRCLITPDLAFLLEDACRHLTSLELVNCSDVAEGGQPDYEGTTMLDLLSAIGGRLTSFKLVRSDMRISPRWFGCLPKCQNLAWTSSSFFQEQSWSGRLSNTSILPGVVRSFPPSLNRLSVRSENPWSHTIFCVLHALQRSEFLPLLTAIPHLTQFGLVNQSPSFWEARDAALLALEGRGLVTDAAKLEHTVFNTLRYPRQ